MKFTQYLLSYLKQAGITKIFGVPGREGEYIRFNETPGIEYISTHLEFNGGLIADYLARITQTVQVCFCTLGPGATTAFTPLASSRLNFSPTIFIFAQVEHDNIFYNLTHQCVDQVSMAQPLAKWAYELKSPEELIDVLNKAFAIALEEPVGPVVLSIPIDFFSAEIPVSNINVLSLNKAFFIDQEVNQEQIIRAHKLLSEAQAPICLIGYETIRAEAQNDVIAFCEQWNIPMITSANAKGILKESHPLNLGAVSPYMAGILGSETVLDDLFASKDLIVTVGYQYVDDIYPSMWNRGTLKKLIHISAFCPTPLEPQYKPDVSCLGKIQESFHLLKQFVAEPKSIPNTNVYKNRIKVIYNEKTADKSLSIFHLIKTINDNLQEGIFVTDVGFFKHYAILFAQPQTAGQFITDAGLSSFGTGLGAAAAAQIAHPDKTIFLLCGDGGFQASSCDLSTLVQQQLPLIIIIANTRSYELIHRYQLKRANSKKEANETITSFGPVDYVLLAKAHGCNAFYAKTVEELHYHISMHDKKKPLVIECPITYKEFLSHS
jgi:N2-(2-carboxyethyl)arginine synthase